MNFKTSLKILIAFLVISISIPLVSADVGDVEFPELPSAWETGTDLDYSMTSTGSGLETVILQSRRPDEPGFTDRRTKTCNNYAECNWNLQHSEDETGTFEYRFRVQSQDGFGNSRRQQVTYYNNLDYSVEWTNEPPETSSQGSNINMAVTAHDSAGRFDSEGFIRLQYRDGDGNWQSFDSRTCSNSDSSQTCSNSGETVLDAEKLNGDTARFRGKVFFQGGVSSRTSVKTVSLPGESGSVDDVDLNDLPDEAEDGSSFDITADAEGQNLQNIYIQRKAPGDAGWTDWRSTSCDGDDNCEFTRTYTVSGTDQMEFRAYAEATGDSDSSSGQTVDFTPRDIDRIDSVTLDNLPDEYNNENSLEVTGDTSGNNLDEIILRTRESGESWSQETSQDCNNEESCEFDYSFETDSTENLEFRLRARAGEITRDSESIEVIDFYTQRDSQVDSVDLDNLDSTHPTGEDLEITGYASGQNLDRIRLQKRDPNSDWDTIETQSCSGNNCEFNYEYQQNDEEEVDFRLKAEADGDSRNSGTETVDFQDDAEDNIDSVSIDDLPSTHPTDENLEVSGEAEGQSLDQITIQQKNSNSDDWNSYRSRDCNNNDQCSISRDFTTSRDGEKDFRIRIEADGDTEYSGEETVDFQEEDEDSIDSVNIENLPQEYDTGQDLEISGDASGQSLDQIIIQQRRPGNSWNDYRSRDCDGNSNCQITRDFSTAETGERDFRIKVETGGSSETSGTETVTFSNPEPEDRIDTVSIDNLPDRHPLGSSLRIRGDASGRNLQTLYIQRRSGGNWENYRSKDCQGSDTCLISREFTADSTGDQSFRIKIQTDENTDYSGRETVNFYTPRRINSVSINQIADRKQVGTGFQITGEASGENLESIEVQRRPSSGNWQTLDSGSCNGGSCSLSVENSEETSGTYEYRVRADAGDITRYSGIQVLEAYREQQEDEETTRNRELSVNIEDTPSRKTLGTGLRLRSSGTGENLETLEIQARNSTDQAWNSINSKNCGSTTHCSYSQVYSPDETGRKFFRAVLSNGTDSRTSRQVSTEFYIPQNIGSVRIQELPDEKFTGRNLEVTGYSSGSSLDQLVLEKRVSSGSWTTLSTQDCTGSDSCSINYDYIQEDPGETEFRLRSIAGDRESYSGIQVVRFIRPGIDDILESVDVSSPDNGLLNQDVTVEGSASGTGLESISLEYRESGSWIQLSTGSCQSGSCTVETNYSRASSGTTRFRTKVSASGQSRFSNVDQTVFYPENGITNVEIFDLPSEHPLNQEMAVGGSAQGQDLENLYLQSRIPGDDWSKFASRECTDTSCSIESSFTEVNEVTREFRVKASSASGNATSTLEETRFREVSGSREVFSVNLDNLPDEYRTGEELEIAASVSGNRLESLEVQKRRSSENWDRVERRSCSGSSCSLETDYTASNPGSVEFRAVGKAGDDRKTSENIEVVNFRDSQTGDGGDTGLDVEVEDEESRELEDARVRVLNEEAIYTDRDGEASFDLEPGDYEVRVSKSGYETEERSIDIEEGSRLRERFELEDRYEDREGFTVSLNYPETVCEGQSLDVEVRVRNFERRDSFQISGSGLNAETTSKTRSIDRTDTENIRISFQDIEGTGERQFQVRVENSETRTRTGTVEVENCVNREQSEISLPTGLSAKLDSREVLVGETVKISGDVQGVKEPVDVRASTRGFDRTVSSTETGGYSIFYTPSSPGEKTLEISSKGLSTERTLNVVPRSRVSSLQAPRTVLEGENFEICAQVESDTEAEVLLFKDGSRIDSRTGSDEICFETEAQEPGEKNYWVRAATSGETGSASRKVDVIEADSSYRSFPGQISVYKTEPGQAKIEIYNKENSVNSYRTTVEGIESRTYSITDREVILRQGERKTVFLYFSPEKSGSYSPRIKVSRNGEKVFSREIGLEASNTGSEKRSKELFGLFS